MELPDCSGAECAVEFHLQSALYLPIRRKCAQGHGAGGTVLLRVHPRFHRVEKALVGLGWNEYLVTVLNMVCNFVTEYLYDKFVVFRNIPIPIFWPKRKTPNNAKIPVQSNF